jgi:biotin carboxylase
LGSRVTPSITSASQMLLLLLLLLLLLPPTPSCAPGEHLPLDQQQVLAVGPQGHSFEARLYAENVHRNFLPGEGDCTSVQRVLPDTAVQPHTAVQSLVYDTAGLSD